MAERDGPVAAYNGGMVSLTAQPTGAPWSEVRLESQPDCYLLRTRQFLPLPLEEVYAFFEEPRNLARITPPWLNFRILDPDEVRMGHHARISYTIRWLGLPMRWRTLITHHDPPHAFEDSQERGPYTLWVHRHTFREAEGGTWVEDEVRYRLPFGLMGKLAHALVVRAQLRGIFEFRARAIERLLLSHG